MSDSVVHVEIEDVLNTVRRLVSEDDSDEPQETDKPEVCFVLTPAHRVATDEPGFRHRAPDLHPIDTQSPEDIETDELEQLLTGVSSQTQAAETQPEPDAPGPPVNFTAAQYQSMAEAWKNELAAGAGKPDFPETEPVKTTGGTDVSLEDRIAELEEAVSRSRDSWEPDGSEPSRKPELRRHLFEVVDNTKPQDPLPEADSNTVTPVFSHSSQSPVEPLVLVERVDLKGGEATALDASAPLIDAETQVDFPGSGGEVVQDDDVFLDVETLRSMIGELVRDELHGKMGERITRNVRKMVQQEIEKALLSRNTD